MPFTKKYTSLNDVLANTNEKEGCLEWAGKVHRTGYPVCSNYGLFKSQALHREVFRLLHNYYPEVVMHTCDNPRCIKPEHLVAGTPRTNMEDMDRKKRRAIGAKNGNSKFSDAQILQMRTLKKHGASYADIKALFDISKSHLHKIIANQYRRSCGDC